MISIVKPTEEFFKLLEFDEYDKSIITELLDSLSTKNMVLLDTCTTKTFDLSQIVNLIIEKKDFREVFINILKKYTFEQILLKIVESNEWNLSNKIKLTSACILFYDEYPRVTNKFDANLLTYQSLLDKAINKIDLFNTNIMDALFYFSKYYFDSLVKAHLEKSVTCFEVANSVTTIERSGWILTKINTQHKESIAEHMYSMWLIGNFYLPIINENPEYNKNRILEMVMIHDIAETLIGDIPHPLKTDNDEYLEELAGKALIVQSMLEGLPDAHQRFIVWEEWIKNETINSMIAHDLDVLQLEYQFLKYYETNQDKFTYDDVLKWTRRRPKTKEGYDIFNKLISPILEKLKK